MRVAEILGVTRRELEEDGNGPGREGGVTAFVSDAGIDGRFAYQRVAIQLRSAILSQAMAVGAKLPNEIQLAEIFSVSRATVREALRNLAADNLIVTRKGATGGSFVAEPSIEQLGERLQVGLALLTSATNLSLEQFMELREYLEIPAAREAAVRRTPQELDVLTLTTPSNSKTLADAKHYSLNRDFHFVLIEMCHNPLLSFAAGPVFLVLQTCLDRSKLHESFHTIVTRQHRAIAKAVLKNDSSKASELMAEHLAWLEPRYRRVWRGPAERGKLSEITLPLRSGSAVGTSGLGSGQLLVDCLGW
jgi:DNA-binding FadR family transcriptional regulator